MICKIHGNKKKTFWERLKYNYTTWNTEIHSTLVLIEPRLLLLFKTCKLNRPALFMLHLVYTQEEIVQWLKVSLKVCYFINYIFKDTSKGISLYPSHIFNFTS